MNDKYTELIIGVGSRPQKILAAKGREHWGNLTTLDINGDHNPDVVWDLNNKPFPFEDNSFNEIHAYEVLEHIGTQGDYKAFFEEFSEYWRILKPGGILFGTSPSINSPWLWGDPGHTRVISPQVFTFLSQQEYTRQVGKTAITDYRFMYKADFQIGFQQTQGDTFAYSLVAVKPSRITI